jgi:predicted acyltransferase
MAGWASVIFAMFYWLIDVKGYRKWSIPLTIYGMNAIAVFVLSGLIGRLLYLIKVTQDDGTLMSLQQHIYVHYVVPLASPLNASLLYALCFITMMFLVVWFMWWRKWFVKV